MNSSSDLHCVPSLSKSAGINPPEADNRNKIRLTTNEPPSMIDLDDPVPLEDSDNISNYKSVMTKQLILLNLADDDSNVMFRTRQPMSTNRKNINACLVPDNNHDFSNLLKSSDKTLFYVTSSAVNDDDSTPISTICTSSKQTLPSKYEDNSLYMSNVDLHKNKLKFKNEVNNRPAPIEMNKKPNSVSKLVEHFSKESIHSDSNDEEDEDPAESPSILTNQTTVYLERVRENPSNHLCADCNDDYPTIAIMSWLMVICKKCAAIHNRLTSKFLHLQSLIRTTCDWDLIDLINDHGNKYANSLLEFNISKSTKPNSNSSEFERKQYIRKKYIEKAFLKPFDNNHSVYSQDQLNKMLYENVETDNYRNTIHLIMLGADSNYLEKNFPIADHAQRHQQLKQMKIILANGGVAEFDVTKTGFDDITESIVYLANKHWVLKEFLTCFENDRLKVYYPPRANDKSQRCLCDIDLNHVLAICNQSVNAVSLRCRFNATPIMNINSQCTIVVDDSTTLNEYAWVFPNDLERSLWIREIIKRQFRYYQLIYSDFILLMKLNVQEGINAEKQQVIGIVYSGRFVIYSERMFDEVDLRKYSSLTHQKTKEFTGVVLCLVSNRFLYLSSPITKLTDMLYSCLRQAIKVKTLTNLNKQILTSQNIPVIVERFTKFLFEHGLLSKGIYRQAGQETKIKQLLNECLEDPFTFTLTRENYTEHDVANALKRFLRQLDLPLLGTREHHQAWLRSTVDDTMTTEQLIQYYRAILKDLKQRFPIHYSTLRTILMHIHTVAMLSEINAMTLPNLIATFGPCLVAQPKSSALNSNYINLDDRQTSADYMLPVDSPMLANTPKLAPRDSTSTMSGLSQYTLPSSYTYVAPSIQADLSILTNLFDYYAELFDVTDEEFEHEKTCIDTLVAIRSNPSMPRKLDGALISVYFESRADELNGYAMYVFEKETTADLIIDKLLKQIDKADCFFWALFEVIIDQNLERPMYSCENIAEVFYRYRTYLSHELNLQATFVVKLNYVQFEKERLEQRQQQPFNSQSVQCEYFDSLTQRWTQCIWVFERAVLKIYRIFNALNDKVVKIKTNVNQQEPTSNLLDEQSLIYSWSVENIYLYVGADCRFVNPFDMNEYRVLTILPPEPPESLNDGTMFGVSFRFIDRNQMFSWYLELVHINGHDKWTRRASRTMPDGVNYLPLQNYHSSSSAQQRKKADLLKSRFKDKGRHLAANLCKQLRK